MIVSHSHKFIFIKTRKTASTSIEIALSAICEPNDIITPLAPKDERLRKKLTGKTQQNCLVPWKCYTFLDVLRLIKYRKRVVYSNHITASKLKHYLGETIWNDYYVFCFERNPIDKCLSHYKWRGNKKNYQNFKAYLDSKDYQRIQGKRFYKDNSNHVIVDKIYKMEQLEASFAHLRDQLGLTESQLKVPQLITKKSAVLSAQEREAIVAPYLTELTSIFATEFEFYS